MIHLVLVQPEIPQNVGTLARTAHCFGATLHVIGPLGFVLDDRRLKRAGMDYLTQSPLVYHTSWAAFEPLLATQEHQGGRMIALVSQGGIPYGEMEFHPQDILCAGSESVGLAPDIIGRSTLRASIPMPGGGRSLNLAIASSIVLAQACCQTHHLGRP